MSSRRAFALLAWIPLASCAPEPEDPAAPVVVGDVELLAPRAQLIRLSLDLRGLRPDEVELAAIEANPALYEGFVDRYLQDPRFLDAVEELFNRRFLTRTGEAWFSAEEAGVDGLSDGEVADSLNDEPLKLIRHIAANDLGWEQVVLADHSMADGVVERMWGMEREDGDSSWRPARYLDGRPHAGVLSSTTLWTRYPSAGVNANRHRANTVSRVLLCDDYLSRPVSFSRTQVDALTQGDPNEVIGTTPACQSCHSSLDPLASHFFGFWWEVDGGLLDQTTYRPEDEPLWQGQFKQSSAYFGLPTGNLRELGEALAADDRLYDCAVRTVWEGLSQRHATDADWAELRGHRAAFDAGGRTLRSLVRSVVLSPEYRAGKLLDPARAQRIPALRLVSPAQLAASIEQKTGYRWTFRGRDALERNERGLAVLAGGIDSRAVAERATEPGVGLVFVQERLAQAAAWHVARADLAPGREGDARLLAYVTVADTPESAPEAFEAQIRHLYLEITGLALPTEAPEVAELSALWKQVHAVEGSPEAAWAGIVSVVLRDPALLLY